MRSIVTAMLCLVCVPVFAQHVMETKVLSIHDGDTIRVSGPKGESLKVRLDGIDAPEAKQSFGKEAGDYLRSRIDGKLVRIEWTKKDRYDRLLAKVYLDDRSVNADLVAGGYAWHYAKFDRDKRLAELETSAKTQMRGLWREREPVAPWDYRAKRDIR